MAVVADCHQNFVQTTFSSRSITQTVQPAPVHIMSSSTSPQLGESRSPAHLPVEIQRYILEYLMQDDSCSLGPFATVSREWQGEIEKRNFARIKVTASRLREFDSMTHRNRALVRCIWFCVELEEYDCISCGKRGLSELDWQQRDQHYRRTAMSNADDWPITRAFQDLFTTLSTWGSNGNLILDISIYSPSDSNHYFKYLTVTPDTLPGTLVRRRAEHTVPGQVFDDPQHGWLDGTPDPPTSKSIRNLSSLFMERSPFLRENEERQWWDNLPLVPAVTSIFLRQQNRRRWKRFALARMLSHFPRLQEVHYEPWRGWSNLNQQSVDESEFCHGPLRLPDIAEPAPLIYPVALLLTRRICHLDHEFLFRHALFPNNHLTRIVLFENFNQQYSAAIQEEAAKWFSTSSSCESTRTPKPLLSRLAASASLNLEHFAASFIVDAGYFFKIDDPVWKWAKWPKLTTIALTSKSLNPKGRQTEIEDMLRMAGEVALKMPQLEIMELWNGRKGLAGLFQYKAARDERQATITWRGTWNMDIGTPVVEAWEAVVRQFGGWRLNFARERLDAAEIKSHGDAIRELKLSCQIIRPVSLEQILTEQKYLEGLETVE